ncbi:MAG: hypothetical protein IM496_16495 [Microcystis sp. M049S2]|uniref:hypothetical protein n=1 Tax=Microcystis sp. M049S2 TaxID=2771169 RepID=UPI002584B138|nr:hypothetical protein [Microcystis sp. M049S2]MCA2660026.1 hypothetical protein [Microcystis sp. M049S2]
MFNKISLVAGFAGLVALTTLGAVPAQAGPQNNEILISQLRGHNTYRGEPQLNPGDYILGRVRGTVGGIMSIQLIRLVTVDGKEIFNGDFADGTTARIVGDATGGDDILLQVVDGKLVYVGKARPYWVSRLKLKSEIAVSSTRSQLLREINEKQPAWGLPALPPETRTFTEVAPQPAPEPSVSPIRGLW